MKAAKGLPWRLKAKNQREARERFFRFLNRSLSCVCNAHWYVAPLTKTHMVATTTQDPLTLEREDAPSLYLHATLNFHYEPHPKYPGEWKVKTDAYAYSLSLTEAFEKELLSFQWHPESKITFPHVHAALVGEPSSHKAHIPTRRILLEDVLWLAIEDLGVMPIRTDWEELLGDARKRVQEFGSWS